MLYWYQGTKIVSSCFLTGAHPENHFYFLFIHLFLHCAIIFAVLGLMISYQRKIVISGAMNSK